MQNDINELHEFKKEQGVSDPVIRQHDTKFEYSNVTHLIEQSSYR